MVFDFFHFVAMYAILMVMIRLLQAKTKDTAWGPTFAFFG
jgi:hypothetical protein